MIPGIPKAIDLLALEEQAVVPVTLPTGRVVDLHFLDAPGYRLLVEAESSGQEADALRVLAHILPDATPVELKLLTTKMVTHLALVAARKIEVVREVLEGNAGGPPAPASAPSGEPAAPPDPSRRPRSGPRTNSSTRSRGSGASKAGTSASSAASPSTASSSPSSA